MNKLNENILETYDRKLLAERDRKIYRHNGYRTNHIRTDEIKHRFINGDGASWVKRPYDSDTVFQLDKFHVLKKITAFQDARPDLSAARRSSMWLNGNPGKPELLSYYYADEAQQR